MRAQFNRKYVFNLSLRFSGAGLAANATAHLGQHGAVGVADGGLLCRHPASAAEESEGPCDAAGDSALGDKIVSNSGIVGVVVGVKDKNVSIRSGDAKLEILKSSVAEIIERSAPASAN